MKQQWLCSKCGFACSTSTLPCKPIICNSCRSKEANSKTILDPNLAKQILVNDDEGKNNPLFSNKISCSTSISQKDVAFSVGQIGMIFGNLTFEPTLAIPLILRGKSLEPRVKLEVVTDDGNWVTEVQHHFYGGQTLKPSITSTVGDSAIQIKQERIESEELEAEKEAIWDSSKVQKKKRSKLPQYTLSPLARFINHLQQASCYRHRRRLRPKHAAAAVVGRSVVVRPKYDDVLIYEKCVHYVPENEIGLGAQLLSSSPPTVLKYFKTTSFYLTNESSDACSSDAPAMSN